MDIPSYLLGRIKGSGGAGVSYIVVEELPTTGEEGKIYLVPKEDSQTDNVYNEYMYIEDEWELIGDTQADLTDYLKEEDLKTINGNSIVGSGDLEITPKYIEDGNGARMYIVKYTTDSTYNNNIMKPILQAILDDYRNNNNSSNWSIYIDDKRSISTIDHYATTNYTGIYKISILFSTSVQFYNITPTLFKNINTYYGRTGIVKRIVTLNANMSNYVISNFNFNVNPTGLGSFIGIGDNYSTPFNPTQDYDPVPKKYVDDSIASAIGTALQGNY